MRSRAKAFLLAAFALVACGSRDAATPESSALADSCRVRLGPPPPLPAATVSTPVGPRPPSRVIVDVDMKLGALAEALERSVPQRLAEERGRSIGMAGHLDYTVDRGPLSVSIEGSALVVHADVRARAQACKGESCYASCAPEGRATASVPLRLGPDYQFFPSHVSVAFTKPCQVRALGGFLRIDVTDTVAGALGPALRSVEREIDRKLPSMKPSAQRMWSELGKARALPLGGCLVPNPEGLVLGPVLEAGAGRARVRLGLVLYPEIRRRCGDVAPPPPLPRLVDDPSLPADDEVVLATVAPLEAIVSGLAATEPFDAGGARARIGRVTATPMADGAALDLELRGEACGPIRVQSAFTWTPDGRALGLRGLVLTDDERAQLQNAGLGPDVLARSLGALPFPAPLPIESLSEALPATVSSMSDPGFAASARVASTKPLAVTVRGDDVVATMLVRGRALVEQR